VNKLRAIQRKQKHNPSAYQPADSPDLNPQSPNERSTESKYASCREIANIPVEQLQKVNKNVFCWCKECSHVKGQHFNTSCNCFIANNVSHQATLHPAAHRSP
jgi:hypothetical protein